MIIQSSCVNAQLKFHGLIFTKRAEPYNSTIIHKRCTTIAKFWAIHSRTPSQTNCVTDDNHNIDSKNKIQVKTFDFL